MKTTQRNKTLPAFAPALHGAMAAILLAIAWAPQAQAWTPADLPNLALWLDASTATSNAGTVNISNAGSGGGTISGPASLVANGIGNLQAVQFNGTSQYLTGNYTNTGTTLTAFIVGKSGSTSQIAYARLMAVWQTSGGYDWDNTGSAVLFSQNNTAANTLFTVRNSTVPATAASATLTTPFLASSIYNGSTGISQINATNASSSFASTGNFNCGKVALAAGWSAAGPTYGTFWNGTIGEAIIVNASLSISDRQKVEGYLAWKWGTQASLPSDHPYKNAPFPPPLRGTVFTIR